jgi:hypothetical protein
MRPDMVAAIQRITWDAKKAALRPRLPLARLRALPRVLEERLRTSQQELADLHQSYSQLLERLYPSNEVYVVARAV